MPLSDFGLTVFLPTVKSNSPDTNALNGLVKLTKLYTSHLCLLGNNNGLVEFVLCWSFLVVCDVNHSSLCFLR